MADTRISELSSASSLNNTDLLEIAQVSGTSSSGYISKKTTLQTVGNRIATTNTYQSLDTTSKTLTGAINECVSGITQNTGYLTTTTPGGWALPQLGTPFQVEANGIAGYISGKHFYAFLPYPYTFNKDLSKVSITSIYGSIYAPSGNIFYRPTTQGYSSFNDAQYLYNNGSAVDGVWGATFTPHINGFNVYIRFTNNWAYNSTGTSSVTRDICVMSIIAIITINE